MPDKPRQWYVYLERENDDKAGKRDRPGQAFEVGPEHVRFVSKFDAGFGQQSLAWQLLRRVHERLQLDDKDQIVTIELFLFGLHIQRSSTHK